MWKSILLLGIAISTSAIAQDMSRTETAEESYSEDANGDYNYSGKCSTHEVYENKYFTETATLQKYIEIRDLSRKDLAKLINKLGLDFIQTLVKDLNFKEFEPKASLEDLMLNYMDDLTVSTIRLTRSPYWNLIRANVGEGGGNGGYIVYRIYKHLGKNQFQKLSMTFDSDLQFCDKSVWLK